MFGLEIANVTLGIYLVQVVLIPTHIFLYLSRRIDHTRLRFLFLSFGFVAFSSVWIFAQLYPNRIVENSILPLAGVALVLAICTYYSIELSLKLKRTRLIVLTSFSVGIVIASVVFEFVPLVENISHLLFQVIVIFLCVPLIVSFYKVKKAIRRKPLFISAIGVYYIILFVPLATFVFSEPYIKFLFFSSGYLLVLWAYFMHYFRQMKFENSSNFVSGKLNLEEYSRLKLVERLTLSDSTFAEFDFNERELEVASLLLLGLSSKEIAERLFLDYSTIRGYASKVYSKTGIYGSKRAEQFRNKFGSPE